MVHVGQPSAINRSAHHSKIPCIAAAVFTGPAPWAAPEESDRGVAAHVLKRTVAPQAHAHFQRILQVAKSELSKLLLFKVHQLVGEPVRPEIAAQTLPPRGNACSGSRAQRKEAAHWQSSAPAEAEGLTAYVIGTLQRILVDFSRFADAVLRWQLEGGPNAEECGPEDAQKCCNNPPMTDLVERLERLDRLNTELEAKYNAVNAEMCEKRRAFLRDQAASAERLQRVRSHCRLTGNQELLDALEHDVQFYCEPEPEMEDEVTRLRKDYDHRIEVMQQEHEAKLNDCHDNIFSLEQQLEHSQEIEKSLRQNLEQMVRQRRATGSLEKALALAEEAAEKAEAGLRIVQKDAELLRASNRTMGIQIAELEKLVEHERVEASERERDLARRLADLGAVNDLQERCPRDLSQLGIRRIAHVSRRWSRQVIREMSISIVSTRSQSEEQLQKAIEEPHRSLAHLEALQEAQEKAKFFQDRLEEARAELFEERARMHTMQVTHEQQAAHAEGKLDAVLQPVRAVGSRQTSKRSAIADQQMNEPSEAGSTVLADKLSIPGDVPPCPSTVAACAVATQTLLQPPSTSEVATQCHDWQDPADTRDLSEVLEDDAQFDGNSFDCESAIFDRSDQEVAGNSSTATRLAMIQVGLNCLPSQEVVTHEPRRKRPMGGGWHHASDKVLASKQGSRANQQHIHAPRVQSPDPSIAHLPRATASRAGHLVASSAQKHQPALISQIDLSAVADMKVVHVLGSGSGVCDPAAPGHPLEFGAPGHQRSFSEASQGTGRASGNPDHEATGEGADAARSAAAAVLRPSLDVGAGGSTVMTDKRARPRSASTAGCSDAGACSARSNSTVLRSAERVPSLGSRRLSLQRTRSVPEGSTPGMVPKVPSRRPSSAAAMRSTGAPPSVSVPVGRRLIRPQSAASLPDATRSVSKSHTFSGSTRPQEAP